MPPERGVILNQLARGAISEEDGRRWFVQLAGDEQREALNKLWFFAAQAGARESDVDGAITRADLEPTFTPCVLLKNGRLRIQTAKLLGLPHTEHERSFRLLLALFQIADERRRSTTCINGCSHRWHATIHRS
ncbi:DUF5958 family protein [Sorangium sp. So ce233]|uniref:DUF5958 family protein n=1 Tax=Sorangium sp. So ce233 TaxID=3133290 RepID=UPI003F62C309